MYKYKKGKVIISFTVKVFGENFLFITFKAFCNLEANIQL